MNTKALRQKILDLAIHGKLVPQDPNDEPASVLLERIRAEKERLVKEGKIKRPKKTKATSDKPHYENLLPEGWTITTLGEIFQHNNGKQKSSSNKEGRLLKYITTSNVYWGEFDLSNVKEMFFTNNELEKCTVTKGDLLVCEGGDVGRSAIWNYEYPICIQNHLHRLRSWLPVCTEYFFYSLMYNKFKNLIKGKGIGLMSLSSNDLHNIPINLPPVNEQKRIVAEINRWFDLFKSIENNTDNLNTLIKTTKSKVLDLAIHGKLVPQEPTDEPATELLKRINPNAEITSDNGHYQKLPEGWVITSISDMCENINGLWKGKKEPFVKVGVIRNANFTKDFKLDYSKIEYIDVEERAFKKRHLLNGDLIVEKSGGSDNNPVGRAILYEGKDAIFSFSNFTMVLRIHYKDVLSYKYLYYYIMSKYQKGEMRLMQTQTTGLHNLILDKYLDIPLCLPPYQEQQRIINKIEETFGVLDLIMENL